MMEKQGESCVNLPGMGWQMQGAWLTPSVIKKGEMT